MKADYREWAEDIVDSHIAEKSYIICHLKDMIEAALNRAYDQGLNTGWIKTLEEDTEFQGRSDDD
jgi:hypothetical protein